MTYRHKVFISYHHQNDEAYRHEFEERFAYEGGVIVPKAVYDGQIASGLRPETIRRTIRERNLRDSTVTVVLVGSETWKRKHVDWEIASSLRNTPYKKASGLLGILLPSYPGSATDYDPHTIPPRLWDNVLCEYAEVHDWTKGRSIMTHLIHAAFLRRKRLLPAKPRPRFKINRHGERWWP
ncbi:MAG: hypothetical protein EP329_25770 [Deltaproteobacteria bacterium]|nr:MAG: hypothetical protein EP329_25770 [Deltaproteobacteria bacterium]